MIKLVALYKQPDDRQVFDDYYFRVHIPLVEKMPGLEKVEITRLTITSTGEQSPYYLQAILYFKDMETMQLAMNSPEGKAVAKDVMTFAGELVTMIVGEDADGGER